MFCFAFAAYPSCHRVTVAMYLFFLDMHGKKMFICIPFFPQMLQTA